MGWVQHFFPLTALITRTFSASDTVYLLNRVIYTLNIEVEATEIIRWGVGFRLSLLMVNCTLYS